MPESGENSYVIEAEIFSVGQWNGEHFSEKDLEEIARNFQRLREVVKPPLKFGHDENQTLLGQRDGDPSLGWVQELRVRGGKLIATFAGVPAMVHEAIRKGRYRRVSAELYFNVRRKGKKLGKVLKAVALLGADLPAVTNLKDLGAYLAIKGATGFKAGEFRTFSIPVDHQRIIIQSEEKSNMNEAESPQALPGELQTELAELRAYKEEQETMLSRDREQRKKEAYRSERRKAMAFCEEQVRAGRLAPHLREILVKEIDAQAHHFSQGGPLRVSFDWVRRFIQESSDLLPAGETAYSRDDHATSGESQNPSERLALLAADKMTELGITYGEASEYILRTHPELAEAYRNFTLNPQS